MWQFIVLGYLPGTDIQINFQEFIGVAGCIGIGVLSWMYYLELRSTKQTVR